jgi:hypothetical protein
MRSDAWTENGWQTDLRTLLPKRMVCGYWPSRRTTTGESSLRRRIGGPSVVRRLIDGGGDRQGATGFTITTGLLSLSAIAVRHHTALGPDVHDPEFDRDGDRSFARL